jgi:DNA topoisomerase-1
MPSSKSAAVDISNPDALSLSKLLEKSLNGNNGTKKLRPSKTKLVYVTDPVHSAKEAGLRYVLDTDPGLRRMRAGKGFYYVGPDNKRVSDAKMLRRIRSLAIPPAWTDVWISPIAEGHLQATGRDARGRKQYRYHPRWKEIRDSTKFDRLIAFGEAMPAIRARVEKDLALPGLPRERVLATIVRLLQLTLIRVGNEEYARSNNSYGLTTLRDHHVQIDGSKVRFRFKGKGGKLHDVGIRDKRLARIVQKCQDIPGQELFQYIDEKGNYAPIGSADVNAYLREITGQDFTAKDFRTWAATVLMAMAFVAFGADENVKRTKKQMLQAVEMVSQALGNTPTICRKSYIHPAMIEGYTNGALLDVMNSGKDGNIPLIEGLAPEEFCVLTYLRKVAQAH